MSDWIDLTRPMNAVLPIYAEPGYSDPPLAVEPWCDIPAQGYEVWRLSLGTQTGTHVDAPRHFAPGGAGLEALSPQDCVGRYVHLSRDALAAGQVPDGYAGERLLFLAAVPKVAIGETMLRKLLALPASVWIMAGSLSVESPDPFRLHRALAEAGRFLVEDLDPSRLSEVRPCGEAIVLPLRLEGVSGSPVRILVRSLP